jgi:hypothetical protein
VLSQGPGLARNEAEASVASRSAVERKGTNCLQINDSA